MKGLKPRYSKEDFALRGDEIYKTKILPQIQTSDEGKFVAIDIETGEFAMDKSDLSASNKLFSKNPEAQIWLTQVGADSARRFGARRRTVFL